jgi:hypothetical protein
MTFIALGIGLLIGFLVGALAADVVLSRLLDRKMERHEAERTAWAAERRDLNNRIQVPEAAPFMDAQMQPGPPMKQFVSYDDDEGFAAAQEEGNPEWP